MNNWSLAKLRYWTKLSRIVSAKLEESSCVWKRFLFFLIFHRSVQFHRQFVCIRPFHYVKLALFRGQCQLNVYKNFWEFSLCYTRKLSEKTDIKIRDVNSCTSKNHCISYGAAPDDLTAISPWRKLKLFTQ